MSTDTGFPNSLAVHSFDVTIMQIRVALGSRSYDIAISSDDRAGLGQFARERVPRSQFALIVGDSHTEHHVQQVQVALRSTGFTPETSIIPAGESSKCLAIAERLYNQLAAAHADRRTLIVAVGGGMVGDLAGFVAATYNRGLPLLMVPTTLLAMVDSSVGGKVGINLSAGKNLVGEFHQPAGVWIDTGNLATLPEREYLSGLAEVVKYGVILDPEFFEWLEGHTDILVKREPSAIQHVVARSCRLKADVVEKDEREETGLRIILNYGHTFAHAFETAGGYGSWLHGEAVAAGMVCASRLAERIGLISPELTQRQIKLLQAFQLPVAPRPWDSEALIATMRRDKKSQGGRLRFVLPRRLGEVTTVDDIDESVVRDLLTFMME